MHLPPGAGFSGWAASVSGAGGAGTCRPASPVVVRPEKDFRGSSRDPLNGAYPAVGALPRVRREDYCMAHLKDRGLIAR